MNIAEQNSDWSISRLLAEERFKSLSARVQAFRFLLTGLIAVASPVLAIAYAQYRINLSVIGAAVAILSALVLQRFERNYREIAAVIKEGFDVKLFNIPWNRTLIGTRITDEEIYAAAEKFHGDRTAYANWYPDPGQLPGGHATMLCQRASVVWDLRLRRRYAQMWLIICAIYIIASFSVGLRLNETLYEYLLIWIVPSSTFLVMGIDTCIETYGIVRAREQVDAMIEMMWRSALEQQRDVYMGEVRGIQDGIYELRRSGPVVARYFASKLRRGMYHQMHQASQDLRREFATGEETSIPE